MSSLGTITMVVLTVMEGAATGLSIMLPQFFGAKDERMVKKVVAMGTCTVAGLSVVMGFSGAVFALSLLHLIILPENILEDATVYLRIVLLGTPMVSF
ncbi:MAG: hypothetical protein K2P04_10170 [Oscillospiraceae bacterium]|nr:hypothetical protein [Oscillospiraceae bacterium]